MMENKKLNWSTFTCYSMNNKHHQSLIRRSKNQRVLLWDFLEKPSFSLTFWTSPADTKLQSKHRSEFEAVSKKCAPSYTVKLQPLQTNDWVFQATLVLTWGHRRKLQRSCQSNWSPVWASICGFYWMDIHPAHTDTPPLKATLDLCFDFSWKTSMFSRTTPMKMLF